MDMAQSWVSSERIPELQQARHLSHLDIDSGHWPMVTKPVALARLLAQAAPDN